MKTRPFSIGLLDDAEVDFDKSYEFYNEDSPKVADVFFQRINLGLEDIKQNPNFFQLLTKM
jgi:hypothetical protein